jgi:hypothetical protein
MIQGLLPAIPEDEVLVMSSNHHRHPYPAHSTHQRKIAAYHDNQNIRSTSSATTSSRTQSNHDTIGNIDDDNDDDDLLLLNQLSPFGYIAIVRNDTILLEVGRRSVSFTRLNSQQHEPQELSDEDADEDDDEDNTTATKLNAAQLLYTLDQTIHGVLQQPPIPGWDVYSWKDHPKRENDIEDEDVIVKHQRRRKSISSNPWTGLRFHDYDDQNSSDVTIWSFCVVFRHHDVTKNQISTTPTTATTALLQSQLLLNRMKQWMIEQMVQFTSIFRRNDIVWKTGSTLSCQYIFAPVVEQRISAFSVRKTGKQELNVCDDTTDYTHWMNIANEIMERNQQIASADYNTVTNGRTVNTDTKFCSNLPTTTTNSLNTIPESIHESDSSRCKNHTVTPSLADPTRRRTSVDIPFVSDESDSEHVDDDMIDDEEDSSSDSDTDDDDEEDSTSLLLSTTPVRSGALPINYGIQCMNQDSIDTNSYNDDDTMAYINRMVASTSIWNRTVLPVSTSVPSHHDENRGSNESSKLVPTIESASHFTTAISCTDNESDTDLDDDDDDDDDKIPLICLVGNQVDAQHSDLWKRSPKSITKAVALGLHSPRSPRPKTPDTVHVVPTSQNDHSVTKSTSDEICHMTSPPLPRKSLPQETVATTIVVMWNNLIQHLLYRYINDHVNHNKTNRVVTGHPPDDTNQMENENQITNDCCWCQRILPSKASAIV